MITSLPGQRARESLEELADLQDTIRACRLCQEQGFLQLVQDDNGDAGLVFVVAGESFGS